METKVCKCCNRELSINQFKRGRYGAVSVCLECDAKHRRENKEQREKELEMLRAREEAEKNKRQRELEHFTPRELMEELARRGYKGELTYTKVETIDITNF